MTSIWGPSGWRFGHYITFGYPESPGVDDKKYYHTYFTNLQHVLPCPKCRKEYANLLKQYPVENYLENREQLVRWFWHIHNEVNKRLGKSLMSYDNFIKTYEDEYKGVEHGKVYEYRYPILFIVLGYFAYKYYTRK